MSDRSLRAIFLSMFFWVFGFGLYDDLLPIYGRVLGATPVQLGLLFTVRQLTITAGSLLGGVLADRYNRRAIMLPAWILAAPVPLLFAAAPTWAWLLPGIFLYDITIFGLPAMYAYVTGRTDPQRIASTFATLTSASALALLVSPALGGWLAAQRGIRAALLLAFLCYVISSALIFLTERERAVPPAALPWRRTLRFWDLGALGGLLVLLGLMTGIPLALAPFVPPFLREVRGLNLAQIGVLGSILSAGGLIFTLLAGRAADRWGHRLVLLLTLLLTAAGTTIVAVAPIYLLPLAFLIKSRSAAQSLSQAVIGARVSADAAGRGFGLLGMVTGLVAAGGTFLAGLAYRVNPALPLLAGAVMVTALAAVLLFQKEAAVRSAAVE